MLQISTWSKVLTCLVLIAGFLIALPNALPTSVLQRFPAWWPTNTIALGLDLQGGSYLLLEVELDQVQKDRIESLAGDIRSGFRKAHIGFTDLTLSGDTLSLRVLAPERYADAKSIVANLNPQVNGSLLAVGARAYDLQEPGQNVIVMKMTDTYKNQTNIDIVNQSVEVVRKRIDQLGTREPSIERQGDNRIVVQVPGLSDPQHLVDILGKTAKMTFQMVDDTANVDDAVQKGIVPIGSELLYQDSTLKGQPPTPIVVEKHVVVAGDRLTDAQAGFSQDGGPSVNFRFDTVGAREFGEVTKENVGRHFAIILDGKVIYQR